MISCSFGQDLPVLKVPAEYNYIGVFLTLNCNLRCSYCINRHGELARPGDLFSGEEWVAGLNRLQTRDDLPITLQGGEPSLHPDFYEIINGVRDDIHIDLLTNLQFDVDEFMERVPPSRLKRDAPYASIRVSYHPSTMDIEELLGKVVRMLERDYSIGVWAVDHPDVSEQVGAARERALAMGIDFRLKEFLGKHQGRTYGTYKYPEAITGEVCETVECRTTELLIDPMGRVHRCHSDLYAGRPACGNLLDPEFRIDPQFKACSDFGTCNPCDIKVKTNRFQKFGHTSVEIRCPAAD